MFKKSLFVVFLGMVVCGGLLAGEVVFEAKTAGDFRASSSLTAANGVFTGKGAYRIYQSAKALKLEAGKKYRISGEFRAKTGTPVSRIYIGLVPLDKNGKAIVPATVNGIHLLETQVTRAAEAGSTALYVKNASRWKIRDRFYLIALNIRAAYADLPNANLVKLAAVMPVKEGNDWKLTLAEPLKQAVAPGVYIRLHRNGDKFMYAGNRLQSTENWQKFSGVIDGTPRKLGISRTQLWPGTAQVRFLVMSMEGKRNTIFEFKNMKLEVMD